MPISSAVGPSAESSMPVRCATEAGTSGMSFTLKAVSTPVSTSSTALREAAQI